MTIETSQQGFLEAALGGADVLENNKVRAFAKNIDIKAPIVIDATTQEGVQPLLDLSRRLKTRPNTEAATAEVDRMESYFNTMSVYLTELVEKSKPVDCEKEKKLVTSKALKGIFNALAKCTRSTLLSEVIILPTDIRNGPAKSLYQNWQFNIPYELNGYTFDFGFLKIENRDIRGNTSSTTVPTFEIDRQMMANIAPYGPLPLLRDLQDVMSFVNHDVLHHYTLPFINSSIAGNYGKADESLDRAWMRKIPAISNGDNYETWAHMGHEKALLFQTENPMVENIRAGIDRYFDELGRISEEVLEEGHLEKKDKKGHEVVNFYGLLMAHALTRIFPLNHPVMTHCLTRMQQTDPLPQLAVFDYLGTSFSTNLPAKDAMEAVRVRTLLESTKVVIAGYKEQNFDILPKDDNDVGYINFKLLQLTELAPIDVAAHIPVPIDQHLKKLRTASDDLTLDLIKVAAQTSKYEPS